MNPLTIFTIFRSSAPDLPVVSINQKGSIYNIIYDNISITADYEESKIIYSVRWGSYNWEILRWEEGWTGKLLRLVTGKLADMKTVRASKMLKEAK